MNLSIYQQRVNAMRLNRQPPNVKQLAEAILKETDALRSSLYWALDPDDQAMNWTTRLIEHAHALVDIGHEYKTALDRNPPPADQGNDWETVDKNTS